MTVNLNKSIKLLCFVAVLLLAMTGRAATIGEERMVSLTMNDGLTGETAHSVMTDHNGLTWIATNSGVNVYNGRTMQGFRIEDARGRYLSVEDLCEVGGNCIYAATLEGLYRLVHGTDRFERVLPEIQQCSTLLSVGDTLYIGGEQGLMVYDGRQLKHVDISPSRKGLDNIVRQYALGDDGRVWFLSRHDLNSYDPRSGKITPYRLDRQLILTQFAPVGDEMLIIGTRGSGLFTFDIHTRELKPVEGVGNIVMSVQRAADGSICVATDGTGAYRLSLTPNPSPKERGTIRLEVREHFSTEGDASHRLTSNGVYCYYRDTNGVNWFGFVRHGLAYTYYSGDLFKVFGAGGFTTEGMNVRTFCRHGDDALIGTQNGFYYVNTQTGQYRYYSPQDLGGGHIVTNIVWWEGRFYVGTFDGGLRVLDPQTLQLSRQALSPLLDNTSIGDLKTGPDGRLWIGSGHGLMIAADGKLQQHFTEQNSHIVGGLILSIAFDRSGNAWVTGAAGCSLYSVQSHAIVETNFPKGFFNREPWMKACSGHDGLVFMRTGPQTFYTNEQMTDFGELQLRIRFNDKWCRNMVDDMHGYYLLSSERGLFCFSYDLKEMFHFGYAEGLRGDFINDMGGGADEHLWVATSQGLFMGDQKDMAAWRSSNYYKVLLINVWRGSDLLPMAEGYLSNTEHRLRTTWNLTSVPLQMNPLLMDYSKPTGRLYEYKIGGGDWQLVNDGQQIDLRHLELGDNILTVRLAGAEGTASVYTITVVPSFWAWFELVLLMVAVVLLFLWWRWRKQTKVLLAERDEIEDALVAVQNELSSVECRMESVEFATASDQTTEQDSDTTAVANSTLYTLNSQFKYQKVKVDEEECAAIVKRMKEYLNRERVYTNADLKMKDLADVLHLSAPKLSQVFNLYLGQNYYDFINGYRLAEFKRLIDEGEYKRYTITALSEQCGFKKSNFFSTFRKVEGMTPAEYLKKKGVKML